MRVGQKRGVDVCRSRTYLAVFIDFENLALVSKERGIDDLRFRSFRALSRRKAHCEEAYADWIIMQSIKRVFMSGHRTDEIPKRADDRKNSATSALVDAIDSCYSKEHIDTFVVVSGTGLLSSSLS